MNRYAVSGLVGEWWVIDDSHWYRNEKEWTRKLAGPFNTLSRAQSLARFLNNVYKEGGKE